MKSIRIAISGFWVLTFVLFAALQMNDPDPVVWMALYLGFAALAFIGIFKTIPVFIYILSIVFACIWAALQWPAAWEGFGESMLNENMERARESVGLLICAFASITLIFAQKLKNTK